MLQRRAAAPAQWIQHQQQQQQQQQQQWTQDGLAACSTSTKTCTKNRWTNCGRDWRTRSGRWITARETLLQTTSESMQCLVTYRTRTLRWGTPFNDIELLMHQTRESLDTPMQHENAFSMNWSCFAFVRLHAQLSNPRIRNWPPPFNYWSHE